MLTRMIVCIFVALAVGVLPASAQQVRLLVPRADSPTAMVRCGAEIEAVKAEIGASRRHVFNGEEVLTGMQYCVPEAGNEVHTSPSSYRVPAGTIGWLAPDGRVVLEECVNQTHCQGCNPSPQPLPEPIQVVLPPRGIPRVVEVRLAALTELGLSGPVRVVRWEATELPDLYRVTFMVRSEGPGAKSWIPCVGLVWKRSTGRYALCGLVVGGVVAGTLAGGGGGAVALVKPATAAAGSGVLP